MDTRIKDVFASDPSLFPHMLDIPSDKILLSRISEKSFKQASFLDERIITDELARETVSWKDLAQINCSAKRAPYYIFHIGHVGSTLISRLIGQQADVLSLREPHILRSFAEISQIKNEAYSPWSPKMYEQRIERVSAWLARSFHSEQRSVIKASSFVSEIASDLLQAQNKAMFLYSALEDYLAGIFAGPASRQEALLLSAPRIKRITRRLGPVGNLWEFSEGQIIALGWLAEMTTLWQTAHQKNPEQILWQNFDRFLAAPSGHLLKIAAHLDIKMTPEESRALTQGPIMSSYSKAPQHNYSPALRKDLLQQARAEHKAEIRNALEWVTSLTKTHTEIKALMDIAAKD